MKDIGKTTRQMEKDVLYTLMEMFMKVTGKTIKPMAEEFTLMLMDQDMKGSGSKISNMEWVLRNGLMVPLMRDTTFKERSTAKVNLPGLMVAPLLENFTTTIFTEVVFMNGQMAEFSQEIGGIIRWKAMGHLRGPTVEGMSVNTQMT